MAARRSARSGVLASAAIGALLGVAAGFLAGSAWMSREVPQRRGAAAAVAASRPAPDPDLVAQRDQLAAEVARLSAALEVAQAQRGDAATADEVETPDPDAADADPEAAHVSALEAAGWRPTDIERLRREFDAYELERLYLRDRATREGWRGSARFRREQRELLDELHDELGDGDYDAALYAEGRNNRVMVQSLLDDSPAEASGLRVGDEILRYAGERIFEPIRLVRLTVAGEAGRPVEMRVLRGGEEIRLFVPRGPLGARLRPVSRPPIGRP
jgi:hypothetical protein